MKTFAVLSIGVLALTLVSVATAAEDDLASTREAKSLKVVRSPRIEERRYKFHNSMNKNSVAAASSDSVELKAQQVRSHVNLIFIVSFI